jgi:hypothetical protein
LFHLALTSGTSSLTIPLPISAYQRVGDKTWIDVAQIPYGVIDWMPTSGFQSMVSDKLIVSYQEKAVIGSGSKTSNVSTLPNQKG